MSTGELTVKFIRLSRFLYPYSARLQGELTGKFQLSQLYISASARNAARGNGMPRFENGWIKLYRRAGDSDIIKKGSECWVVWTCLLMDASRYDLRVPGKDGYKTYPPGTIVLGLREYAERCHISVRNLRTALEYLEGTERITKISTHKGTIISIPNYEKYQEDARDKESNAHTKRHTSDTQTTHRRQLIGESKKERINTVSSKFDFELVWSRYPKKRDKTVAKDRFDRLIRSDDDFQSLLLAVDHYRKDCEAHRTEIRFIKNFATFLGTENKQCWREWIDPPPQMAAAISKPRIITDEELFNDGRT